MGKIADFKKRTEAAKSEAPVADAKGKKSADEATPKSSAGKSSSKPKKYATAKHTPAKLEPTRLQLEGSVALNLRLNRLNQGKLYNSSR